MDKACSIVMKRLKLIEINNKYCLFFNGVNGM